MTFYYFVVAFVVLAIIAITVAVIIETVKRAKSDDGGDIKPIEYNAPDNLNSAEAGYIYHGSNSITDTISLLPFLASKGYIEISNMKYGQKKSETEDDMLYILKKYDGENISEKMMMEYLDRICVPTDKKDALKEIPINKAKENFIGMDSVIGWRMSKELDPKIFNRKFKNYAWAVNMFFVAVVLSVLMISIDSAEFGFVLALGILVPCVCLTAFVIAEIILNNTGLVSFNSKTIKKSRVVEIAIGVLLMATFGIVPIFFSFNVTDVVHRCCDVGLYILGFCCSVAIVGCIEKIRRIKSEYGKEVYEKICGFREYLEKVEKDKIETLVKEDPKLCYKMMAYAYALGVSKDWVDEFEAGIRQV